MKQVWLDRVHKELKDRQLSDLYWPIEPGIVADPFAHRDDFLGTIPPPIADLSSPNNDWEICETIPADDAAAANRLAMTALEGGATALCFCFEKNAAPDLDRLLDGIFLEMIGLHFSGKEGSAPIEKLVPQLRDFLFSKKTGPKNLHGSLHFEGEDFGEAIGFSQKTAGRFRVAGFAADAALPPSEQLAGLLKKAVSFIEVHEKAGFSPETVVQAIHFELPVGTDFLLETAKFRAFRALWLNIQKAWGSKKLELPVVHAVFSPIAVLPNDPDGNFIRSTTLAMAAIIGGCNRLTVSPAGSDAGFHRRIARNVQHLLKMEAGLDRVQDPAAGSFFVEKLTGQLVEAVWEKL